MTRDHRNPARRRRRLVAVAAATLALGTVQPSLVAASSTSPELAGPGAGTASFAVDPVSAPGALRLDRGWAVRLRADRPAWLTPELLRRVREANGAPVAAPAAALAPEERGIRPGTEMVAPYGCTMNFLFRRAGDFALGTAGHCVDRIGQHATLLVRAGSGTNLVDAGPVVRRAYNRDGVAPDFAIVRIRERLEHLVAARIVEIGGPCGIYRAGGIRTLMHYGYPLGLAGIERTGISLAWRPAGFGWAGAAIHGDSGSPVRTGSYGAAGSLSGVILLTPGWIPGELFGTRMTWIEGFVAPWRLVSAADCT